MITDLERKEKFVIKSLTLTARLAVLDPELLAGLPVQVAAQTSLDALSHIVESFVSRRRTPLTESMPWRRHGVGERISALTWTTGQTPRRPTI